MNNHDPQRRTLLRGALAAGVTMVLASCDRSPPGETTAQAPATPPPAPPAQTPPSAPMAEQPPTVTEGPKVTKEIARYQEMPKGDQKCANCANFIAESRTCKVVEGSISPEGWCVFWVTV